MRGSKTINVHYMNGREVRIDRTHEANMVRVARLSGGPMWEVKNHCGETLELSASHNTIRKCLADERARGSRGVQLYQIMPGGRKFPVDRLQPPAVKGVTA